MQIKKWRGWILLKKKGNVWDAPFIIVALFVVIIAIIVSISFFGTVKDDILADDPDFVNYEGVNESLEVIDNMPSWFDGAVLFLLIGFTLAVLISSALIDVHPAFFIVGFLVLLVSGFIGVALEETGSEIITDADFINTTNSMTYSSFIMDNLFKYMVVLGFLGLVVLFTKGRMNAGGGGF